MKKSMLFVVFMLVSLCGFSQSNYKFNYQAVVRNGAGTLVPNGSTVSFRLSILESTASGTVLYAETHSKVVNNGQGLVSLVIGSGSPTIGGILFSGNFQDLSKDKYLKVEVDPTGGTSYTDMGATQLQFVPYAAHAFTASIAENGTQWSGAAGSDISYTAGKVTVGTSSPSGSGTLNVEQSTTTGHVISAVQTGTAGGSFLSAVYGKNNATGANGIGVMGEQAGNGWGVYGRTYGATGTGVYALGATGMSAKTSATNGIAIDLDGFIKVNGTKTAFKTTALVSAASNITLSYGGAASTDMVFVTPISTSTTMPSWALIWSSTSTAWQIWNASDDGIPSNFPAGTSFNILVIKQ